MKYNKIKCNNYDIYFIKSNKFKTVSISTVILNNYDMNEITESNFISEYLVTSTKKYSNEVLLSRNYLSLYDPRIDIYDIFRDIHAKCFDVTFLNEKFTEKGMNKKTVDFYYDLMFDVNEKDGVLDKDISNSIIRSLETDYKLRDENPGEVAFFKAKSYLRSEIPFKYDTRGNREDLNKINIKKAYDNYLNKLKNGKFYVFVIGDLSIKEVKELISSNLDNKVNNNSIDYNKEYDLEASNDVLKIEDKQNFNQSIIYFIYKLTNLTYRERYMVLPIFNEILGGSSSKLFNNVREKNSLAYYAYSYFVPNQSVLYMYAGINKDNYEKTVNIMQKQVENIRSGKISKKELDGAKNELFSYIRNTFDKPVSILTNLKFEIIYKRYDYDSLIEKYNSVTKQEIINLTDKLNLDVLYFLKGEK